ncbi:Fic family protein [Pseudanabaena sp. FACHB-1277]|jgi:Fic family protein|uniref:Fic family protein n=1 Tax=Pseudanabaena cinerea FACHB-1277 TaxID=2949581 RepID=A0A926UVK7_9CYAN|nr:Fic family protein [Pseudanabaena cinerea]MBD2150745.1 Fic family protein [Pseudanabaena cinerea FACHB-1277]
MQDLESILTKINQRKSELDILRQNLDNATIKEALKVEFLYESNRIEGNTLTLRETQLVINEGMTISGKSMREHLEAINHKEAILFIEDLVTQKMELSEYILKQIHGIVLYGIDRKNAGVYRKLPVAIAGSKHLPPQPYLLQDLMEDYFRFYELHKNDLHPVVLAAEMHERLVSIHPFIDGNGRTSRLIMNLILLQHGFPLAIIGGDYESRMAYYDALEKVQAENDKQSFILLIAEKVLSGLDRYINILNPKKNTE